MTDQRTGEPKEKIESAKKAFWRGGNFLQKIFSRPEKFLTKNDCMILYNTYAITPFYLTLLCISHDFDFDEEGFCKEVLDQIERQKKSILC